MADEVERLVARIERRLKGNFLLPHVSIQRCLMEPDTQQKHGLKLRYKKPTEMWTATVDGIKVSLPVPPSLSQTYVWQVSVGGYRQAGGWYGYGWTILEALKDAENKILARYRKRKV